MVASVSLMWPRSTMRLAQFAIPVAVGALGYALIVARGWAIRHELQVIAAESVAPGQPIPVRAFVFADIDAPAGATLVAARVWVKLEPQGATARVDTEPFELNRVELNGFSIAEGALDPLANTGTFRILAYATDDAGTILATAERELEVSEDAPGFGLVGREAFQHLQRIGDVVMQVGVEGGVCVPDEPCSILVSSAVDRVSIDDDSVEVREASALGEALHRVVVVLHGPEAEIDLVGWVGPSETMRQTVQLPVALATPWLDAPRESEHDFVAVEAIAPPGRSELLADVFVRGRWIASQVIRTGATRLALGDDRLYRVELRVDPFGGDRVAARYVARGPLGPDLREILELEGLEPGEGAARLLLARAEERIRVFPAASSGLAGDIERLHERQARVFWLGVVGIGAGIVVFSLTLLWRGLGAAAEARQVMESASGQPAKTHVLPVIAIVGAIVVSWLAGATLLLIRVMVTQP